MFLTRLPLPLRGVRLACVKPAASVRSEPGSNSQVEGSTSFQRFDRDWSLTISVLSRAAKNLLTSPKHTGPRSASRRRRPDGLDPNVTVKVLSQPRNPSRRTNRKTRKDPAQMPNPWHPKLPIREANRSRTLPERRSPIPKDTASKPWYTTRKLKSHRSRGNKTAPWPVGNAAVDEHGIGDAAGQCQHRFQEIVTFVVKSSVAPPGSCRAPDSPASAVVWAPEGG